MARAPLTRSDGVYLMQKACTEKLEQKNKHKFFKPHSPDSPEIKKKPFFKFTPRPK